jgi:hypothetical protein
MLFTGSIGSVALTVAGGLLSRGMPRVGMTTMAAGAGLGLTTAAYELPDLMMLDQGAQAGRGGAGTLTSQSPEEARNNYQMGVLNLTLAGLDVGSVAAAQKIGRALGPQGVSSLGKLERGKLETVIRSVNGRTEVRDAIAQINQELRKSDPSLADRLIDYVKSLGQKRPPGGGSAPELATAGGPSGAGHAVPEGQQPVKMQGIPDGPQGAGMQGKGTTPHNEPSTIQPKSLDELRVVNPKKTGDFSDISGKSVQEVLSRVPKGATMRKLTPVEGGSKVGVEYKWIDENGVTNRLRVHDADPSAPVGSNAAQGWVARHQVGGKYYDPEFGGLRPRNVHKPESPYYDPKAANDTHIPIETPDKSITDLMRFQQP